MLLTAVAIIDSEIAHCLVTSQSWNDSNNVFHGIPPVRVHFLMTNCKSIIQ